MTAQDPATKNRRRHGRRRILAAGQRLDALIAFCVTAADRDGVYAFCDTIGVVPAAWIRGMVLSAVRQGGAK